MQTRRGTMNAVPRRVFRMCADKFCFTSKGKYGIVLNVVFETILWGVTYEF